MCAVAYETDRVLVGARCPLQSSGGVKRAGREPPSERGKRGREVLRFPVSSEQQNELQWSL